MKRYASALLALLLMLTAWGARAASTPFEDDYGAINEAAGSVLMLLVYDSEEGTYVSTGSGFVAFDSRTLITNYHVVEDGDLILAESDDGKNFFLDEVLAADSERDLAILRFKADSGLKPLALNRDGGMLRGQPVVAIGSPEGYRNTVSKGDISALFTEKQVGYIQFTAPISHGSSGGALFNNRGEVIGVTSSSVMGDSQNMNFAIDIREAISLYEASANAEPSDLGSLASAQSRTREEPEASPSPGAGPFFDLRATQTAADSVTLTWGSRQPGQACYIGYETDGGSYYNYRDTTKGTTVIDDLVPGLRYNFFIADSLDGLDAPPLTISLALRPAAPFSARSAKVLGLGLHFTKPGEGPELPLPPGLQAITTAELRQARLDMALSFTYRVLLEDAAQMSTGNCVYAFFTPGGGVYTDEYYYSYEGGRYAYIRRADMKAILTDILEYEGGFAPGAWRAAVYHDGALLGETAFEVREGPPEPGEPEAGGEGTQARLEAGVRGGTVHLNWSGLPEAESYQVYRGTSAEGHYFYLGSTQDRTYEDSKAVRGRTYFYKVHAVSGGETLAGTPPVSLTVPSSGEGAATELPPTYPLEIGNEAYVGDSGDPFLDPDLINLSAEQKVVGFRLAYFGENRDFEALTFGDTGKLVTYLDFKAEVLPGQTINAGGVSLRKYGGTLHRIYVAIARVVLEDGSSIEIPEPRLRFKDWTLD